MTMKYRKTERQFNALRNLKKHKYTPTDRKGKPRTKEQWNERVASEIATLKRRLINLDSTRII